MSAVSHVGKDLLSAVKLIVPTLSYSSHKGTAGRIGIIGGSEEYTGAPFFAGIAAMRTGADLGHVFCPSSAATVIKTYSPDLIVHPVLSGESDHSHDNITAWFPRLHALVVGPGLGRDTNVLRTVKTIIETAKSLDKNIVIDADGLFLITMEPSIITSYPRAILAPNMVEFQRLFARMLGHEPCPEDGNDLEQTRRLAAAMGHITIVKKGKIDIISNGHEVMVCDEEGSPRRVGGQGDLLVGSIGTLSYWARQAQDKLHSQGLQPSLLACYAGCLLVKRCARAGFAKHGRSMLASDMLSEMSAVSNELFCS